MLMVARSADVVARVGGDEFVVVFEPNEAEADALVRRLDEVLAQPIRISDTLTLPSRASVGYADTRTAGSDASALLAAADAAMYEVKREHRREGALADE